MSRTGSLEVAIRDDDGRLVHFDRHGLENYDDAIAHVGELAPDGHEPGLTTPPGGDTPIEASHPVDTSQAPANISTVEHPERGTVQTNVPVQPGEQLPAGGTQESGGAAPAPSTARRSHAGKGAKRRSAAKKRGRSRS